MNDESEIYSRLSSTLRQSMDVIERAGLELIRSQHDMTELSKFLSYLPDEELLEIEPSLTALLNEFQSCEGSLLKDLNDLQKILINTTDHQ